LERIEVPDEKVWFITAAATPTTRKVARSVRSSGGGSG